MFTRTWSFGEIDYMDGDSQAFCFLCDVLIWLADLADNFESWYKTKVIK